MGATWCRSRPRSVATSAGVRSAFSPGTAAFRMLIWFDEPIDLDKMSLMPAHSTSARTGPPAMTPVPGAAGFSSTRPAPASPITSCGIVVPIIGTSNIVAAGLLDALRDRGGHLLGLAVADADPAGAVADDDERGEARTGGRP